MRKSIIALSTVLLLSACGEDDPRTGLGATQEAIQQRLEQQERENQERKPTNRENEE